MIPPAVKLVAMVTAVEGRRRNPTSSPLTAPMAPPRRIPAADHKIIEPESPAIWVVTRALTSKAVEPAARPCPPASTIWDWAMAAMTKGAAAAAQALQSPISGERPGKTNPASSSRISSTAPAKLPG